MEQEEVLKSLKFLSNKSKLAKRILKHGVFNITTIFEENSILAQHPESKDTNYHYDEEIGFHPSGKSGIILMNDEYIFGIRCNHLQWVEGSVEYDLVGDNLKWYETLDDNGKTTTDDSNLENMSGNAIMLIGNHKGSLIIKLITIPYSA